MEAATAAIITWLVEQQMQHEVIVMTLKACFIVSGPTYTQTLRLQTSHGSTVMGMQEFYGNK